MIIDEPGSPQAPGVYKKISVGYDAFVPIGLMELIVIGVIAFVIYISIKRSSAKKG